jgi:cation transport protein ChaC
MASTIMIVSHRKRLLKFGAVLAKASALLRCELDNACPPQNEPVEPMAAGREWRAMDDFWVFGYGSLMWRPGFAHTEVERAHLHGYHRALCVHSYVHRGTPQRPGLVLGLDRGGSCIGLAFKVPGALRDEVMDYLRARELVTSVYIERLLQVRLASGPLVPAVAYVVDRTHPQYAGRLQPEQAAKAVCGAVGQSGPNEDYVLNTVEHLRALAIRDPWLESVARLVARQEATHHDGPPLSLREERQAARS